MKIRGLVLAMAAIALFAMKEQTQQRSLKVMVLC